MVLGNIFCTMSPERERIRGMAGITGSGVGLGRPLGIEVPDLYIVQLDARLTGPIKSQGNSIF